MPELSDDNAESERIPTEYNRNDGPRLMQIRARARHSGELQTCAEKQRETAGEPAGDDLDQMTTQELKDELNVLIREQATEIVLEALKDLDESNCPSTT